MLFLVQIKNLSQDTTILESNAMTRFMCQIKVQNNYQSREIPQVVWV
jgi:hypothetical protein